MFFSFCLSECEWETKEIVLLLCLSITLSGAGVWTLNLGRGGEKHPLSESTLALPLPKKWSPTSYLAKTKMFQKKNSQKFACNMYL